MSGLRCPACGLVNFASSDTCRRCGRSLSEGVGISTAGLPLAAPLIEDPLPVCPTEQMQAPGAGAFGMPQQPPGTFSQAQPSGSLAPPSLGSFSEIPPSADAFPRPPLSGSLSPTPSQPGAFGQAQPPAPFGNAPFSNGPPPPAGAFGGVPPQGGFIPTPPEAAPYARAPYEAVPYQATYAYPAGQRASLRQGMAITSLVLGCLGPFSCAVLGVGSIVGLVLGIVATVKAQKYPAQYGGKVMAIIGIALNGFSMVVVLPIVLAITIPNLLLSRMAANEALAMATLRSIGTAEARYQSTVTNGRDFGNLDQLVEAGFLRRGSESKSGYRFEIKATENRSRWGSEYLFEAFATPAAYNSTGRRSYYVNQEFVIRGADKGGRQASSADAPVDSLTSPSSTKSGY